MYNKSILMGRICNDLELKTTPSGVSVLTFTVAVDRAYQADKQNKVTDFFPCVAWRTEAEFISHFFAKGRMILVEGEMQIRKYTDKQKIERQVTELIIDRACFTGEKTSGSGIQDAPPPEEPPQYKKQEKSTEKDPQQMTAENFTAASADDYPF